MKASSVMLMWVGISLPVGARRGHPGYVVAPARTGTLIRRSRPERCSTMIIDTMAPEAVEQAGAEAGLATVLGFAVAAALSGLE